MKILLIPILSLVSVFPFGDRYDAVVDMDAPAPSSCNKPSGLLLQPDPKGAGKMSSVIFKSQDYCWLEMKDFEFDVKVSVVSATVYFSGTNFRGVEKGFIVSNSLKPIRSLMDRCQPGTVVIFDDVKVKCPGDEIRPIAGVAYQLF